MPYITRPAGAVSTQRWAEPLALRRCRSRRADRSLVVGVSTKYEQCCFSPVPLPLRAWVMSHEEARSVPGVSRDPGVGVFSARVRHILRLPRYHPASSTRNKRSLCPTDPTLRAPATRAHGGRGTPGASPPLGPPAAVLPRRARARGLVCAHRGAAPAPPPAIRSSRTHIRIHRCASGPGRSTRGPPCCWLALGRQAARKLALARFIDLITRKLQPRTSSSLSGMHWII